MSTMVETQAILAKGRPWSLAVLLALGFASCLHAREIESSSGDIGMRSAHHELVRSRSAVDANGRWIASQYADSRSIQLGILDVTKAPYSADPTGRKDSTSAIQRALNDARDARLITFLPAGTYRVSDTITCIQGIVTPDHWLFNGSALLRNPITTGEGGLSYASDYYPCILMGSRTSQRSTLLLAPRSAGFRDPAKPKPVLHFWARFASKDANWWALRQGVSPDPEQPDPRQRAPFISYNQLIVDIDLVLGNGNPGAVGVNHQAAQGSAIEDVMIDASGAFAGVQSAPGSGGGIHGLRVLGGQYGLYLRSEDVFRGTQPVPVISNVTLKGQTARAIVYDGRGPLTVVGGVIEGSGVQALGPPSVPWDGAVSFVDTEFRTRKDVCAITSNRSVYLHDVYFTGSKAIVCVEGRPELSALLGRWTHVSEHAVAATLQYPSWFGAVLRQDAVYLNGRIASAEELSGQMGSNAPPVDLQGRHAWRPLPSWDSKIVANVQAAPYGAKGDGTTDDAPAIQRAIDENEVIFLPKGEYKLSRPLLLKPRTRLFGVSNVLSVLSPLPSAAFMDPERPAPLIDTVDDAQARTELAFVELRLPMAQPSVYALRWRAGRNSTVRNIRPVPTSWEPDSAPALNPMVQIEGSGGGRWYDLYQDGWWHTGPDYRHLLVKNTREPLSFYMLNPEHGRSNAQIELYNARSVSIYSLKAEGMYTVLWMRGCRDVRIFGYGGPVAPRPQWSIFRIEDSQDLLLANINPVHFAYESKPSWDSLHVSSDPEKWFLISDSPQTPDKNGSVLGIEQVLIYKRGNRGRAD